MGSVSSAIAILHISSDHSAEELQAAVAKHPLHWLTLDFSEMEHAAVLARTFEVKSLVRYCLASLSVAPSGFACRLVVVLLPFVPDSAR